MIEQKPFKKYKTEEKEDTFTVRVNAWERKRLNAIKKLYDIASDSKALKLSAFVGVNVLQATLGAKNIRYLMKQDRKRLSDFEDIE